MAIQTPDWVKTAVFYQIFPDRFYRSPRTPAPPGITFKPWGSPPAEQGYQGGDLRGMVDKLDYLQELGVTALYLNPVFASASNHRYHTYDYFQVDPLLGGNAALRELLDAAHARNLRVVLDAVFNHASRGFWPFHHILENGSESPYLDWFTIEGWPLRPYESDGRPINYAAWWGIAALPKFNIANPGVRDYLFQVAKYWIDFGIDGWRLDVPEEISDESFWQHFRHLVKQSNPQAYIVGEIWNEAQPWLRGDRFDAVMNYIFSRSALGFFASETLRTEIKPGGFTLTTLDAPAFAQAIENMLALYDWQVTQAQLNMLDSHDMPRALWLAQGDTSALRLCVLFQMTMPGAPCVYYGSEVGMTGGHDPECRAAFPWPSVASWDKDLYDFYRQAIALRHAYRVLSLGGYKTLYAAQGLYAFRRDVEVAGKVQSAVVIFNSLSKSATLDLPQVGAHLEGQTLRAAWGQGQYTVYEDKLSAIQLPARNAVVLVT